MHSSRIRRTFKWQSSNNWITIKWVWGQEKINFTCNSCISPTTKNSNLFITGYPFLWSLGILVILNISQFSQDTMATLGSGAFHILLSFLPFSSPIHHICPPIRYYFRCLVAQEGFSGELFGEGLCHSLSF